MDSGEIASIATVIGTLLAFAGVSGIDSALVSQAVTGFVALVTVATAVYAHMKRVKTPVAPTA